MKTPECHSRSATGKRRGAVDVNAEIGQILARALANNAPAQVTGALLCNAGNFAQVPEGPSDAVGNVFKDSAGPAALWRARPEMQRDRAVAASGAAFAGEPQAGDRIMGLLQELVRQDEEWALTDAA